MQVDTNYLAMLRQHRHQVWQNAKDLADKAADENRAFTGDEQERWQTLNRSLDQMDGRLRDLKQSAQPAERTGGEIRAEQQRLGEETERQFAEIRGTPAPTFPPGHPSAAVRTNPLAFTSQALDALQGALDSRSAGRFVAADTEQRAALTTGTYGAPRVWGSNVLGGPRMLHVAAGVPTQEADAVLAQHPNLTLPTAQGSVGENVSLAEFAASTAGSVTLARFGRWTDVSRESTFGTDAGAIVGMHQIGVALDLDAVLIDATETAAGAAEPFDADVPAAIRRAIARVISATAAADSADLVVLVNPADSHLLQDVSPIGGQTIAEGFQRFSGSLVYPSSAVDAGLVTVANLRAGARFFEAQRFLTETEVDVKTGTLTTASSVIAGYGVGLTGGFASKQDVVSP